MDAKNDLSSPSSILRHRLVSDRCDALSAVVRARYVHSCVGAANNGEPSWAPSNAASILDDGLTAVVVEAAVDRTRWSAIAGRDVPADRAEHVLGTATKLLDDMQGRLDRMRKALPSLVARECAGLDSLFAKDAAMVAEVSK